jgi:hypothetical protein
VKKWKPLFQMLANLAVSFTCAALLLVLFTVAVRPRGIIWFQVRLFGFLAVFALTFRLIGNYHRKKNAQSRT